MNATILVVCYKSKLRAHRGIGKNNRMKLIDEYILRHY